MLLSRSCDGCVNRFACKRRFRLVSIGEYVYCPDGSRHLVDEASMEVVDCAV